MIFNSIRWRLQIWYGVILIVVLAGFGFTAYQLERGQQFRRFDDELQPRLNALMNGLRLPGLRDRMGGRMGERPERPFGPPDEMEPGPGGPMPQRRPEPGEPGPRPPFEFHLPPQQAHFFDETDTNGFYYVVWSREGELARSTNAPADVPEPVRRRPNEPQEPRMRGGFREGYRMSPRGEIVLAGRSTVPEEKELRRAALMLAAIGGGVLLLGLAGGGWIASRAIRPVEDISATAVKIAAGDLSQRINVADTENELGRLAGVLNSTFARLDAAFAQQRQFASDAAHELRTPVSVMLTQTQSALHRERSAPEYRETVAACERAAQRMRQLIESLLELTRLDAGQEAMKRLPFDLAETARDCAELVAPLAEERRVQIHCKLAEVPCVGDPERISQVITNLLTNAIQYNKTDGEVWVGGESVDGTAVLTIADSGEGIPPEDLPHLFQRFFRADRSRSSAHSGLGLAISKAIVEAHGGTIEVASRFGTGTTFTVRLPGREA